VLATPASDDDEESQMSKVKLSEPMKTMIRDAARHTVRMNGKIVRRGWIIAGRVGTVVAIMDRGLATAQTAETYGQHWLTEAGEAERNMILGSLVNPDAAADAARRDALAAEMARDMGSDTVADADIPEATPEQAQAALAEFRARRDAERVAFDADTAAVDELIAQGADIDRRAESGSDVTVAEASWHAPMHIPADDVMIKVGRTFVSQAYLNTMRRVRADRASLAWKWADMRQAMTYVVENKDWYAELESMVALGAISFRGADKSRRIIRNIVRPTMGPKRKPSKRR
jgi:hypothetical protein